MLNLQLELIRGRFEQNNIGFMQHTNYMKLCFDFIIYALHEAKTAMLKIFTPNLDVENDFNFICFNNNMFYPIFCFALYIIFYKFVIQIY